MPNATFKHPLLLLTLVGIGLATLIFWPFGFLHFFHDGTWPASGGDFLNYWAAPRMAREDVSLLFTPEAYQQRLASLFHPGEEISTLNWSYPPHALFFCIPFSYVSYPLALASWSLLGLTLFVWLSYRLWRNAHHAPHWGWLILAPATLVTLFTRQNGLFIGAGTLAVFLLMQHQRYIWAGLLLGCLTIKPHLFFLWPVFLLITRQWRVIGAAMFSALLLIGLSLWQYGWEAWALYAKVTAPYQWLLATETPTYIPPPLFNVMMPSITVALRLLHVPLTLTIAIQIAVAAIVVLSCFWLFRRPIRPEQTLLLLASGAMLISPYGFNYDLTFFTAALLYHAAVTGQFRLLHWVGYLAPVLIYIVNLASLPVMPLLFAAIFYSTARDVMQIPPHKS